MKGGDIAGGGGGGRNEVLINEGRREGEEGDGGG